MNKKTNVSDLEIGNTAISKWSMHFLVCWCSILIPMSAWKYFSHKQFHMSGCTFLLNRILFIQLSFLVYLYIKKCICFLFLAVFSFLIILFFYNTYQHTHKIIYSYLIYEFRIILFDQYLQRFTLLLCSTQVFKINFNRK